MAASSEQRLMEIMAAVATSAAEPWMGVLMAALRAWPLALLFDPEASGKYRLLPSMVVTYPSCSAFALWAFCHSKTWATHCELHYLTTLLVSKNFSQTFWSTLELSFCSLSVREGSLQRWKKKSRDVHMSKDMTPKMLERSINSTIQLILSLTYTRQSHLETLQKRGKSLSSLPFDSPQVYHCTTDQQYSAPLSDPLSSPLKGHELSCHRQC